MTRTFAVPARYRRLIESALAIALSETARDAAYRAAPESGRFGVALTAEDLSATGMITITVETDPNAVEPAGDFSHYTRIGSHLQHEEQLA